MAVPSDGPTRLSKAGGTWKSSPRIATTIRWTVGILPSALSFFVTFALARVYPAAEVGLPTYAWWICLFALGLTVLLSAERVTRGLLPLAALFKLSLVFPDEAPSRFNVAMRNNSTKKIERRMEDLRTSGFPTDESQYAETMLELVAGLSLHDRMTRGHSERVRAYTDMIAEEMKLPEEDAGKLRWAALLHDVGKIFVSADILNKPGRPTEEEWVSLKSHTWKGDELIAPLKEFLGEWGLSVRNHHERWDGRGYPDNLAGGDIPLGARIVAVADAFDVMTSTRSYKEPRPATEARAEIAACAGGQFDPTVARAFLNIGLGRLRFVAGPLSWLANIQAATQVPVGTLAQPIFTVATAIAATVAAGAGPAAPAELAFTPPPVSAPATTPVTSVPPTITIPDATIPPAVPATNLPTTTPATAPPSTDLPPPLPPTAETSVIVTPEDEGALLVLSATAAGDVVFSIVANPNNGTISNATPAFGTQVSPVGGSVQMRVIFTPEPNYFGRQSLEFMVCNSFEPSTCDRGVVTIDVQPVNDLPVAVGDSAGMAEDTSLTLTPALVLANDTDAENDPLSVSWGIPTGANSVLSGGNLTFIPLANSTATNRVPYQACDPTGCGEVGYVTISIAGTNDLPIAFPDRIMTIEDESLELLDALVLGNDIEVDGDPLRVNWVPDPTLDLSATPPIFNPPLNFNGEFDLTYQLCDPTDCVSATATLVVAPVDDPPEALGETHTSIAEDTPFVTDETTLLSNDFDADGDPLAIAWGTPDPVGQFAANASGVVYIPPLDYNGQVSIPYSVCSPDLTCSATVSLEFTVTPIDDQPEIDPLRNPYLHNGLESTPSNFTTTELLEAISDLDTAVQDLSIVYVDPVDGNFTDNGDGSGFTYNPAVGSLSDVAISYEVCDLSTCVPGTVTLTFAEVFDPPAPSAIDITLNEDSSATITRSTLEAAANDPDTAGADLVFTFETNGLDKGFFSISPESGPFASASFTGNRDENGLQIADYEVCDNTTPEPNCATGTINLNITPTPDAPITTGAPTPKSTPMNTPVLLDQDYAFFDADGDTPTVRNFLSPDGTAVRLGDNTIEFTPNLGFSGQTTVTFDLCDATTCTSDAQLSKWEVTVVPFNSPSISDIGEQQVFIGVPVNAGPFAVDNPSQTALSYTHDLPAGLSLIEGVDEISIVGTITDPSLLGADVLSEITVTDGLGQTSTSSVFFKISNTGLSPLEGNVLITEVLSEDMDWCDDETGSVECVTAELIELLNISNSTVDMSAWTVQSFKPGTIQTNAHLKIEIGPDSNPVAGIDLWPTSAVPGEGTVLHTRWLKGLNRPKDYNRLSMFKDHIWLLDGDGLIVDYMGWSTAFHLGHDHADEYPDPALGIWDVADYGAMQNYAGEYSRTDYTSMSLATLNNANTAACWEFTTSGSATSGGYLCSEPDAFVTVSVDSIMPNHPFGMLMSFNYYNRFN